MVVEVIINSNVKNLNKTFDYNVPAEFAGTICVGKRVMVPFGRNKSLEEGFVVGIKESSEFATKNIERIEEGFELTQDNINLAKLMARRYFCNISDCIKLMLPPGTTTKKIENRVKEKNMNFVFLKKDFEDIENDIENKKIKSEKQIRVLKFLKDNDGILKTDLEIFSDTSSNIIKTLEKNGYIEIIEKAVERNPFINKNVLKTEKLKLNQEQEIAFNMINEKIENNQFEEFLLYGVTGSGKTEVYLQLIEKVLIKGKRAIVLVPEISLTPQMVDRFIARFGQEKIAVLHSKLSVGERYDQWQNIKQKKASIIIGARSAIFAPIEDLGIIIIDEEHDSSYKSDMTPRYNAKDLSRYIAKQNNIPLVLGSATPDITTYYKAQNCDITLLELNKRANNANLPEVEIVDLRDELASGNKSMLSKKLYTEIEKNLEAKKQTILFLNRRGYSTFVICRDCGYTAKCKNCDITLTYHIRENKLKCHYCGFEQNNLSVCPECNSSNIRYFGTGTQKLEAEINKLFPQATTIRMDIDTVTKKNSHEEILNHFKNENLDILIGTQMVVKGHHFPNVTLVGVIAADSSLYMEDYRATERTFQILTQVAGRAGRENLPGKVIIQTYNPDNFSIECAKAQDYDTFYNGEINLRKELKYPPFCDIIVIGINGENKQEVIEISNKVYNNIKKINNSLPIIKPMPSPIEKVKNRYRWRMVIKTKLNQNIIDIINIAIEKIKLKNTRIVVDVNPTSMM